jgi:hypothetical protein
VSILRCGWAGLPVLALLAGCAPPAPEKVGVGDKEPEAAGIRIRLGGDIKDAPSVDVVGLTPEECAKLAGLEPQDERWGKLFALHVDPSGGKGHADQPALLGSYRVVKGVVRFVPRFPLMRGVRYRAVFSPARLPGRQESGEKPVEKMLLLPKPKPGAATVVAQVDPSADRLPENLLKFYLHFSAPMSRGESYTHLRLLNARGKPVDLPFLELDQELWDDTGQRFTLFFDPGRIKRGLKPREEVGPILEEGQRYTLVIDRAWPDAQGNPLARTFRKTFQVLPPDDRQPDPKTWKLQPPSARSRAPLRVVFPKSMDRALLDRLLWVAGSDGDTVPGTIRVSRHETAWAFSPARPWKAGAYHLVADTILADVAGNSIARAFEVDVFRRVERTVKQKTVRIPFAVRGSGSK